MADNLGDATRRAFMVWALLAHKARIEALETEKERMRRDNRIKEGVAALDTINRKQPRHALRSVNKRNHMKKRISDAMAKVLFISKNSLRYYLDKWIAAALLNKQKARLIALANTCMDMPAVALLKDVLTRKPLREAFDRIKAKDNRGEKLRGALVVMAHTMADARIRAFAIWKLLAMRKTFDDRIIALSKKPRIVDGVSVLSKVHDRRPRAALL
jgi:hypothetical protein